jgi:MoxR-like ATPase
VLPQAQLDRFTAQLSMGFPSPDAEMQMLDIHLGAKAAIDDVKAVVDREMFLGWQGLATRIFIAEEVKRYLVNFANTIRADAVALAPPSPRSMLMLARVAQVHAMTQNRDYVTPEDIRALAPEVLAHRMIISGDEAGVSYVQRILEKVPLT